MIGRSLFTYSIFGSSSDTPVVGQVPGPVESIRIGSGGYLTTGTLGQGESGDAGGLLEFAIEGWWKLNVLPTATIDLARGPTGGGGAVQWLLQLSSVGAPSTTVRVGPAGATTVGPLSAGAQLAIGTWNHLVATANEGTLAIYINGALSASTSSTGVAFPVLDANQEMRIGDTAAGNQEYFVSKVAFYRNGLTAARVLAHYNAGRLRGFPSQLPGDRIRAILAAVNSDLPRRISAGTRSLTQAYMQGQAPLDEIRIASSVEASETLLFIGKDGTLVFLDSAHRSSSPYNTVQATFDDDGTDLPYLDLSVDYSESFLANEWNVTRAKQDAVTQTATDAISVTTYLKRSQSLSLPVTTDADALSIANAMLAKYKDPLQRITSLVLSTQHADVAEALFRRDLGDRIRVFRTAPGGGARYDQTLFIQKIEISGANDGNPWQVRWGVSPL